MSWTESFPYFPDEMIDEFDLLPEIRIKEIQFLFRIREVFNRRNRRHVVSLSVSNAAVRRNPAGGKNDVDHSLEELVRRICNEAAVLTRRYEDLCVRVYLANELDRLIKPLVDGGIEVFWMERPSKIHGPCNFWRLLAFEGSDGLVTIGDAEAIDTLAPAIERTTLASTAGLGFWRSLPPAAATDDYRPLHAARMGGSGSLPVTDLLGPFIWHSLRETVSRDATIPGVGSVKIEWGRWPNEDFEDWFLAAAVYPRIAEQGFLTFAACDQPVAWFGLDIEFVTWANKESQIIYIESSGIGRESDVADYPKDCPDDSVTGRIHLADLDLTSFYDADEPIWITADFSMYRRDRSERSASHLIATFRRNMPESKLIYFNCSRSNLFGYGHKNFIDVRVEPDFLFEENPSDNRATTQFIFRIGDIIPFQPEQWVVFIDACSVVLRNMDHLLPRGDPGPYVSGSADLLYIDRLRNGKSLLHQDKRSPERGDQSVIDDGFSTPGMWAVKGKYLKEMLGKWRELSEAEPVTMARNLIWDQLLLSLQFDIRRFERGEVIAPELKAVEWTGICESACVVVNDWPSQERSSFLNAIYLQFHPKIKALNLVKILDD